MFDAPCQEDPRLVLCTPGGRRLLCASHERDVINKTAPRALSPILDSTGLGGRWGTTTHAARPGLTWARGTAERRGDVVSSVSPQGKRPGNVRATVHRIMVWVTCKFSLYASVCRISCMCMPARRRALLVEPSAPPPNIALLALEDNQSNAKALEPTVLRKTGTIKIITI